MEDLNNIIDMSHGTGFSKLTNDDFLPYGKSCLTWQDVKASHDAEDGQVVIRLEEVFGMLIILFVGLSGAAMTMALVLAQAEQFYIVFMISVGFSRQLHRQKTSTKT